MPLPGMLSLQSIIIILLVLFVQKGRGSSETGLRNRQLKIAGEYWAPFFMWECPDGFDWYEDCPGERMGYTGVMWELLQFMRRARNFTFTMVHQEPDSVEWGLCYTINNCTGMIGMVNRKEVDFAIGRHEKLN